jgi:hypothetical protein
MAQPFALKVQWKSVGLVMWQGTAVGQCIADLLSRLLLLVPNRLLGLKLGSWWIRVWEFGWKVWSHSQSRLRLLWPLDRISTYFRPVLRGWGPSLWVGCFLFRWRRPVIVLGRNRTVVP